jgi:hypothetical protein
MGNFSDETVEAIWQKAKVIDGNDSKIKRKDVCDAWIKRDQYGKETEYGWEIDHALPVQKDGKDDIENLRPMHWQNNRTKGDDFPAYTRKITSEGTKNIESEKMLNINDSTKKDLKRLYPNNKHTKNL